MAHCPADARSGISPNQMTMPASSPSRPQRPASRLPTRPLPLPLTLPLPLATLSSPRDAALYPVVERGTPRYHRKTHPITSHPGELPPLSQHAPSEPASRRLWSSGRITALRPHEVHAARPLPTRQPSVQVVLRTRPGSRGSVLAPPNKPSPPPTKPPTPQDTLRTSPPKALDCCEPSQLSLRTECACQPLLTKSQQTSKLPP